MRYFLILICSISLGNTFAQVSRQDFPDVLKLAYQVQQAKKIETNVFSDMGAWHAYTLPAGRQDNGTFIGPMVMDLEGYWLANSVARLAVKADGKQIDLEKAQSSSHYYPGLLQQELKVAGLQISLKLLFISNREAMIETRITNLSGTKKELEIHWGGNLLKAEVAWQRDGNTLSADLGKGHRFQLRYPKQEPLLFRLEKNRYNAMRGKLLLQAGKSYSSSRIERYDLEEQQASGATKQRPFDAELKTNTARWNGYLNAYFNASGANIKDEVQRRIAVKSILTLMTNWRSKAKDLLHDGVFPSLNYQGFYGFWSWDSWKQAVGISYFNPELAISNILSMFDYQDGHGMVADCVYTDKKENNLRDTKPPLAAWAVWLVHTRAADPDFLKNIYPKLVSYHKWWYKNRDHDQNGLCEYGATDGTRIAAAWESGMDNAVRFDQALLLKNNDKAWSLNQESVDLNAYLYAEKEYLAKIADALGRAAEARAWRAQQGGLKKQINTFFYHAEKGFYYDRLMDKSWIAAEGPEGWIPLWAGLADQQQAAAVRDIMLKKEKFNTYLPLPTLTADHPRFDPMKGYWRGPVWLDQVYFGLNGLQRYGYQKAAAELLRQTLNHAEGLALQGPIHENYHPLSGKGLNAMNFSWSAAHLLMLLKEQAL
ncbi:MGH1-like glycoside hydrolase domain-containing protein [Pedobacter africanus]|uniref:Putative isomerase n=1 Tax=Pedobacter africanus TaxID=151894 RepID=A0A1W2AQJ4_9SPHI|nr:trehalase family glycosidase [Pedobacter africanus]SMC62874.1 putative isomerase [Pedobacter africanus]